MPTGQIGNYLVYQKYAASRHRVYMPCCLPFIHRALVAVTHGDRVVYVLGEKCTHVLEGKLFGVRVG